MKLIDLDPSWWNVQMPGRSGMGLVFLCPCCRSQYLGVWFANPLDGGAPAPIEMMPAPRWKRVGETFETLTLTPSIDASRSDGKHWHGFITNGEIK
jgi:hypothetical protein